MADNGKTSVYLSGEIKETLKEIMAENGLSTISAAIGFAVSHHQGNAQMAHELALLKKYANEIRRNNYILIGLLNAVTLHLDVSYVPPHHVKSMQSTALQAAHVNLSEYLDEIMAKNRDAATAGEHVNG